MLLSVVYVSLRDVEPAWGLIARALFYLSPIIYTVELIPAQFRTVVALNPLSPILEQARVWVIDSSAPTALEAVPNDAVLLVPLAIIVGCVVGGVWIFDRRAPDIAEAL